MLKTLMKKVVGSRHEREAKRLRPTVSEINRQFADLASLTDDELRAKTEEFRERIGERAARSRSEPAPCGTKNDSLKIRRSGSASRLRSRVWRKRSWRR